MRRTRCLLAGVVLLALVACGRAGGQPPTSLPETPVSVAPTQPATSLGGTPATPPPGTPPIANGYVPPTRPAPTSTAATPTARGAAVPTMIQGPPPPGTGLIFSFADAEYGWLARGQQILATRDGGRTWQPVGALPAAILRLDLVSHEYGWAGTALSTFATSDGGATWQVLTTIPSTLSGVDLVDRQTAWIATSDGLQRTLDGGRTWQRIATPCDENKQGYGSSFPSADVGWLICVGQPATIMQEKWVYRTLDGGAHWDLIASNRRQDAGLGLPALPITGYSPGLVAIDGQHAWFRLSRANSVTGTSDGGRTWQTRIVTSIDGPGIGRLDFVSATHGFLAAAGILVATEDGGATWQVRSPPVVPERWQLVAGRIGWGMRTIIDQGALLRSDDNGASWRMVNTPWRGTQGRLAGISFLDRDRGWALFDHGDHANPRSTLWQTRDGGRTWVALLDFTVRSWTVDPLIFIDEQTGYFCGEPGAPSRTDDGGRTFHPLANGETSPCGR